MAEQALNQIVVSARTIDIGGDILTISEIARMRTTSYRDIRGHGPGDRLLLNASLGAVFLGLLLSSLIPDSPLGTPLATLGVVLAIVLTISANTGPLKRILVIELSSGGLSILGAKTFEPLNDLKSKIAGVIEAPHPQTISAINRVYTIDLRNSSGIQIGNGNTQRNS